GGAPAAVRRLAASRGAHLEPVRSPRAEAPRDRARGPDPRALLLRPPDCRTARRPHRVPRPLRRGPGFLDTRRTAPARAPTPHLRRAMLAAQGPARAHRSVEARRTAGCNARPHRRVATQRRSAGGSPGERPGDRPGFALPIAGILSAVRRVPVPFL